MGFSNSVIINYPVEEVFRIFIKTAKRDFQKFDETNPVGCKVTKTVGAYSAMSAKMTIEIVDFKQNELYKIESSTENSKYSSTYEFEKVDENSVRLTLSEEEKVQGWIPGFNAVFQKISFKSRVKRRFIYFVEALEKEIDDHRNKLEKNSKTRAEEESKAKVKMEAKMAREAAKKAEEDARIAKAAAAKAIQEAKVAAEQAEIAAKEAEDRASKVYDEIEEVSAVDCTSEQEETEN